MPAPSLSSRLLNIILVSDPLTGYTLYEIREPMRFRPVAGNRSVVVNNGDTVFHIAAREFGDAQLFWAIADWNAIFDVTTELTPGRTIQIPPQSVIDEYLQPAG